MKKTLAIVLLLLPLVASCSSDSEFAPIMEGFSREMSAPASPAPAQPAQQPGSQLPATGLAESQAQQSPEPSPSAEPTVEPTPEDVPQAEAPPEIKTIPGVQEVYYASSPGECRTRNELFRRQGLRLRLEEVLPYDQPGRSGRPRRGARQVPGRRGISSRYGRMFICIYKGIDAVEGRYDVNDDYSNAGLEAPDFSQDYSHPNDYRRPEQTPTIDPTNPNRPTVPDPDPNRSDPYQDLPY